MTWISPYKRNIDDLLDEDDEKKRLKSQAERLIIRFGGVKSFVKALRAAGGSYGPTAPYKWMWPRDKGGTGGMIPTQAWPLIVKAARIEGILLTVDDFNPDWTT